MECNHHYVKRNINPDLKGNPKMVWKCEYCGEIYKCPLFCDLKYINNGCKGIYACGRYLDYKQGYKDCIKDKK